ncbi:MAG: hypothetical protein K8T10_06065 [Candidatus Eremiobacteraeota bacterium]|nr:hypothetical protein [Candidatus Eremiobacteraeota bacterium]
MKKFALIAAVVCLAVFIVSLPAFASVTVTNKTGEYLKLEVRSSNSTTHTSINSSTTSQCGGSGETTIIVKSKDNKKLCQGTFQSGDKVVIRKSGNSYSITKK